MKKTFNALVLIAIAALNASAARADQCHIPVFLETGKKYAMTTGAEPVSGTVTEIDTRACWIRVGDTRWINIEMLQTVQVSEVPQKSPFRAQTPIGSWVCRFAATGKELGKFQYQEDGRLMITGAGSNRTGRWSLDGDNTLIWRYDGGGGEELDYWEISNGQLKITEGADSLVCDAL